ncbi:MAG: DUF4832 domain-containing protein [Pseudomonadota bacterium]|nr:DUF4832 domain-containing protein [Pseudomonadota bacterium]|tara:strand:+ start:2085 stop:3383 length:1299 start_codon:yes stop_codon:yes gene_type:complete
MSNLSKAFAFSCLFILSACGGSGDDQSTALNQGPLVDMPLSSTINNVQPFTGIVTWIDYWNADSIETTAGNTQLEFKYVKYSEIVSQEDQYDWTAVETILDAAASRGNQAIIRFYYTYPADTRGGVPDYILNTTGYNGVTANSEGSPTKFPDWSSTELQEFTLEFYTAFAERYDDDPRLAFLQVGFGLWAEYHIYDGPNTLGAQFPSKGYQAQFIKHLANAFQNLRWSISKDAGSSDYSDIATTDALQNVVFGLFDDSFMHQTHDQYNRDMLLALRYEPRYEVAPIGGEFSYYSDFDQEHVLDEAGMYGRTVEELSEQYHVSYMIGNDQPDYQTDARIKAVGMAMGYKFNVTAFSVSPTAAEVTIENTGIAPIYYDAYPAVNGVRSETSLKGLLPGVSRTFSINAGGSNPSLTIESDRLVAGQVIEYSANLP